MLSFPEESEKARDWGGAAGPAGGGVYLRPCVGVRLYPGGEYCNYGLGGSYMLLLAWPGLLFLAGLIVAALNGKE